MDHWRAVVPGFIYDLRYEDLVADQGTESRKLVAYCGLECDDACLDFHHQTCAAYCQRAAGAPTHV